MKKFTTVLTALAIVLSTASFGFAWVNMRATLSGVTVAMTNTPKLMLSKTENGIFSDVLNVNERYEIKCVSSNDGIHFYDEAGNQTSGWVQYQFYVKSDKKRGTLFVEDIIKSAPCEGLRVSVTYLTTTLIFDPMHFEEKDFGFTTTNNPAPVTVRIWYEGSAVTAPIDEDVTVSLVFGIREA